MNTNLAVALDIETSGLNPADHSVVAVGLHDGKAGQAILGEEDQILREVDRYIVALPPGSWLVTWNGEEFDLPFLKTRFEAKRLDTSLRLERKGKLGKYGKPLFAASWGKIPHVDIAPLFRDTAAELGVRWGLKPVARALLRVKPVEVDNRGSAIAVMDRRLLMDYVLSDAHLTRSLACRLDAVTNWGSDVVHSHPAKPTPFD